MKLSDLKCRKAKAHEKLSKLSDGDGLFLHVYPNGKKLWRMSYRHAGKQRDMAFGPYPLVSLLEAREKRYAARKLLLEGKDPAAEKKAEETDAARREETTFAAYADIYLDRLAKAGRSAPTLKKSRWIVEVLAKDLRSQQLADITPRDVLRVLRVVEAKGNRETARRMRGVLSAVFRLAVIEDVIQADPSAPLKGALLPPETRHQSAVTKPEAFGALLRAIDGYDGHRTRLTFPDGNYVQYTYDELNRMNQVRENGATFGAGLLADYSYDTLGRRGGITRADGGGAQTALVFDGASRISSLTQNLASSNVTFSLSYSPASQILSRGISNYNYRYPEPTPGSRGYTSNGLNQYTDVSGATLSYDERGSLTSDGARRFCYDLENRLIGTAPQSGNACTSPAFALSYDPLGRLRETQAGSTVTQFLYAGDQLVAEFSGSSTAPLRRYAHGASVDEPIVWYEGAGLADRRWLHGDNRGSIIATSDNSGVLSSASPYAYGPHGEPDTTNGWSGSRFRYTGQISLPEVQLYHYKARVYDPVLGRFLQTDPVGYEDDLNLYQYAFNDPVNAIDPTGRDVVVLNTKIFETGFADHQAFLVGSDESRRWEYRSLAGIEGGGLSLTGAGPADYREGTFEGTLAEVLEMGPLAEYENAFILDTTPEQDAQVLARAEAFEADHQTYDLRNCNCGDYTFAAVAGVDPTFPNEQNPKNSLPYLRDPANGWQVVRQPPPLIPGTELR